jgi:hypothetical protein
MRGEARMAETPRADAQHARWLPLLGHGVKAGEVW